MTGIDLTAHRAKRAKAARLTRSYLLDAYNPNAGYITNLPAESADALIAQAAALSCWSAPKLTPELVKFVEDVLMHALYELDKP
jgi:hypothetical protein